MPSSAQVRTVARRFAEVARTESETRVDMDEMHVTRPRRGCRTVACHDGFYALQQVREMFGEPEWFDDLGQARHIACTTGLKAAVGLDDDGTGQPVRYEHGATLLARDLEFDPSDALGSYYAAHPEPRGSDMGHAPFADAKTFGAANAGALTVDDIARHWSAVVERTRTRENATPVQAHGHAT